MAAKIGRNDPCRCGSGKKYKRCCLESDEAAAREAAQEEELFDDDDSWDMPDDIDEEPDALDVDAIDARAITRIWHTRGVVDRWSDFRSGRGLRVTEWVAPDIPQGVLDSIDEAGIGFEVGGQWGDPNAADPIHVDVIDVETDGVILSIEIFNRHMFLPEEDSEDDELSRIHGICNAMESAASGGQGQSAETGSVVDVSSNVCEAFEPQSGE
jgi:hypothetical protein